MATPTSERFSAGASFTPSPVIATMSPRAWSASTRRSFCSGRTRAKTFTSRSAVRERVDALAVEVLARENAFARNADQLRHRERGRRMVAGDHHDADAGGLGEAHGVRHLGARRIPEQHEAQERQVASSTSPRPQASASTR